MAGNFRAVRVGPAHAHVEARSDGTMVVRAAEALGDYPRCLTERLAHWARVAPDRIFVAQRDGDGWRSVTYAQAFAKVRNLGQAMIDRGLSVERPVAILSENDIEHLLLCLAGQHVGVPTAAISTAYSLVSTDFGKLRHVFRILTPGLVFAASGQRYRRALETVVGGDVDIVVTADPVGRATLFADLVATTPTQVVDVAHRAVRPDGIAKFLFTSGSTGTPKGVVNTHRMLCSNQQMLSQCLRFLGDEPPVLLDWLPWNHTFGGNHNVGIALYNGGSFYIDDGKPMPGGFERTIRNLGDVSPSIYFNVPKGFEELLPRLRADRALAEKFFSRLGMMFYAGAGLSQHIWDDYRQLAEEVCGERILMVTSLGSTETAPMSLLTTWETEHPGCVGIPAPGVEVKLVPNGRKLELRIRGPNIMPGYWRQPELHDGVFDDEEFYCMGDALKFVDPADASKGFTFDGRIAEDFKLATGTWVSVGPLRGRVIAQCAPLVRDVVVTGHDRDDIGLLAVPDVDACRALAGLPGGAAVAEVLNHPAVRTQLRERLDALAKESTGSATRVVRALLLEEQPSLDAGEITDKGSLNQREILSRRANLVEALYEPAPQVITITGA